ncbi:MAG TPA: DUF6445 family protein [Allosphingosinicella sp.]|nr:DUF6445 family protein [Allosphingosinicella sp.]
MTEPPPGAYQFRLSPRCEASLERIGLEQEPVLVLDGMMSDPSELIEYAAREVAFAPAWGPEGGYPGIRAPAPLNYVGAVVRALNPMIERAFGLAGVRLVRAECNFSLVTLPPDRLAPLQTIPHADTVDPLQFAVLHYLCDARFGGTAFYRHKATGFETLTPERQPAFNEVRDEELREAAAPAYIVGDTPHYAQTASFEAAMGRIIVYRSRTLHSGQIGPGAPLSEDPRLGRLTANIFVNYRRS